MNQVTRLLLLVCAAATLAQAQFFTLTKEQMIELTAQNPFDRFPDGRPKVPDSMIQRAKEMSAEEVWAILGRGQNPWRNQYADGFQVLHPAKRLVGRAFTVQFMPVRPDVDGVIQAKAQAAGLGRMYNQVPIDMLQPGDVLVVDLFGKGDGGTIVGDNLFYYIMRTVHKGGLSGGIVIDGAVRDLDGISEMDMPAYFRKTHPSAIATVMVTGINIPIRVGEATVVPGDLVFGDTEGIYFIPPSQVTAILDNADEIHVHDEWTRKKFDEGKYKSRDIYGSPRDPELRKEYEEYKKKRLEEIRAKRPK
jgi:4-hydroxy-4-methyl-2-oxoglutarate aldolase